MPHATHRSSLLASVLRAVERSLVEGVTLAIAYRTLGGTTTHRVVEPIILA